MPWISGQVVNAALMNLHVQREWTSYTPTLTNMTLGNGSRSGEYAQLGMTIFFRARFTLGSTSAVAANPGLGLPVTALSSAAFGPLYGTMGDTGTATYDATVAGGGTTGVTLFVRGTNGVYAQVNATSPFTWTNTDTISVSGIYERA